MLDIRTSDPIMMNAAEVIKAYVCRPEHHHAEIIEYTVHTIPRRVCDMSEDDTVQRFLSRRQFQLLALKYNMACSPQSQALCVIDNVK